MMGGNLTQCAENAREWPPFIPSITLYSLLWSQALQDVAGEDNFAPVCGDRSEPIPTPANPYCTSDATESRMSWVAVIVFSIETFSIRSFGV